LPLTRSPNRRFLPASVLALRHYTPRLFVSDLIAGVTVGLVALPLAMAFAISSGMSPQAGIYCALVTGFIISALGGSYVQIGGPTGAFVVVVSGIIAKYGVDGLFMCTMMAGVVLVVMGLTGSGTAVRFIPRPVVIGFTNGIALVIASTQLKDFFGITFAGSVPGEFVGRIEVRARHAADASLPTTLVAVGVLALIIVGAIARTATNVRSGAKTPVAGIIHALTLLAILLFAAPLAGSVPMAVLAAILLVVAYNMGEWREIPELWKQGWTDRIVWMCTFALTVLADLTVAVEAGMIIAALLFIRRVSATTTVSRVTSDYVRRGRVHALQDREIPDYVTIFRIHGPFLFGSTDKLAAVAHASEVAPIVVLRLRNMTAIDATGLTAIQDLADSLHASGRTLLLCGAPSQPAQLMDEAEFHRHVGEENILPHVEAALKRAGEIWAARTQPRQEPPAA
jgi:MFS superfamily sulfate permease-like transporter